MEIPRYLLSHPREVFLARGIATEMQVVLQHIAIGVPLSMEIADRKPVGLKDLLYGWAADGFQQLLLKLIVGQSVGGTATDVVETIPKLVGHPVLAYVGQQTAGILCGGPLQYAIQRHMEGDGIGTFHQ